MKAALQMVHTFSEHMALGVQSWKTVFQKEKEKERQKKAPCILLRAIRASAAARSDGAPWLGQHRRRGIYPE